MWRGGCWDKRRRGGSCRITASVSVSQRLCPSLTAHFLFRKDNASPSSSCRRRAGSGIKLRLIGARWLLIIVESVVCRLESSRRHGCCCRCCLISETCSMCRTRTPTGPCDQRSTLPPPPLFAKKKLSFFRLSLSVDTLSPEFPNHKIKFYIINSDSRNRRCSDLLVPLFGLPLSSESSIHADALCKQSPSSLRLRSASKLWLNSSLSSDIIQLMRPWLEYNQMITPGRRPKHNCWVVVSACNRD